MTWNSDRKPMDNGNQLREKYLSRLQEISSKIETRSGSPGAAVAIEVPAPESASKRVAPVNPTVTPIKETAPASIPGAVPERSAAEEHDDFLPVAERLAPKFVDALAQLLREIGRRNSAAREKVDATDSHLRDQQRVILALEQKILQLEQKLTGQQELQKEQLLRATTSVMNFEQRFAVLEGRMDKQAAAIRTLHVAHDQRREELRLTLQKLGEFSGKREAATLPENL